MDPLWDAQILPGGEELAHRRSDIRIKYLGIVKDLDVAVTHPLRPDSLKKTADGSGSAAESYAKKEKVDEYANLCLRAGTTFVACVMDCYGNWCASGREMLEELASARAALGGAPAHVHLHRLIMQCNVALMLGNARTLHKGRAESAEEALPMAARFDEMDYEGSGDEEDEASEVVSPGQQGHPGENMGPRTLVPGLKTSAIPKSARRGEAAAREALEELCRRMDDGVQSNPGKGHPLYASWKAGGELGHVAFRVAVEAVQRELRPLAQGEADSEEDDSDEDLSFMESEVRSEGRLRWWNNLAAKQVLPAEWREFEQGGDEETASEQERRDAEQQWGLLDTEARIQARGRWWASTAVRQVPPAAWREFEQGGDEETASDLDRLEMEQQWELEQALANKEV